MEDILTRLEKFDSFCKKRDLKYQVHAGFASFLHGTYNHIEDVDIRIFTFDLSGLKRDMELEFKDKIRFRGPIYFKDRIYLNNALIWGDYKFEICSEMIATRESLVFRFPFDSEAEICKTEFKKYHHLNLPVASINFLMLYYLVLRRNLDTFDDYSAIRTIALHPKFSKDNFVCDISSLQYRDELLYIFEKAISDM